MSHRSIHPLIPVLCALLASLPAPGAAAILQIRVVDGDGTMYFVGSRATRGITVEVTDENGKPVEGVSVSFLLPESGAGGVFNSGSRTEIVSTRSDGRATVWGMRWNRTPGTLEVRITAVKDQVRAGTVATQYLSDTQKPLPGAEGPAFVARSSHKWLYIGLAVAGAAGAGIVLGRSHSTTAASSPSPTTALSIGTPSIIIGGPQ